MTRVAINGCGRIGRNIIRIMTQSKRDDFELIAINDPANLDLLAYLTEFDSVHGHLDIPVQVKDEHLLVGSTKIAHFQEKKPQNLPWKALDIDIVLECSGHFCSKDKAELHLNAGAKRVLISAPAKDVDATVVFGVNENTITKEMQVISNASCTTNCLAPIAKVLHAQLGIEAGVMTTIHAYTNDQCLTDAYHTDFYRCRAAALNIIPTKTGAAEAVGLVIPELKGKLTGMAVRVPTANVSLVDCNFVVQNETSEQKVNHILEQAVQSRPDILQCNNRPLVSSDFNHCSASSIFDLSQTKVLGKLVKVMSWYDNEWGFSHRMIDTASYWEKVR